MLLVWLRSIGISIFCRSITPATAETEESNILDFNSARDINNAVATSATGLTDLHIFIIAGATATFVGSVIIYFMYKLGCLDRPPITIAPPQPIITDENKLLVDEFCKLKYENLPVDEIDVTEFEDEKCPICLSNIDKNSSQESLRSLSNNDQWVMYEKQFYHFGSLKEALDKTRKITHTKEDPDTSKVRAVKLVQKLNNTPTASDESTATNPEGFIVDFLEEPDAIWLTTNNNHEENKPLLEIRVTSV